MALGYWHLRSRGGRSKLSLSPAVLARPETDVKPSEPFKPGLMSVTASPHSDIGVAAPYPRRAT